MKNFTAVFIVVFITGHIWAQPGAVKDSTLLLVEKKIDSVFNSEKFPGLLVAINNNGMHRYYFRGYANPETKMVFDSATLFEIGSITKTFTAFVLQKVLDENNIPDSTSITSYLPDSVQNNTALHPISFLSLLNHTSGLPRLPENMDVSAGSMSPYDNYTADKLFGWLKTCRPAPNGKSNYSNLGMGLAGVLAQIISHQSYASLLEKYIFRPFNMIATTDTFSTTGNKSQGFFENGKTPYWKMDVLAPAGGIKCNAKEMLTYLDYMSNPPEKENKKLIDKLLQPTIALSPQMNVCKAWHTFEQKDKTTIYWHNGGTFGFSTFAAFVKNKQVAVMVAVNKSLQSKAVDKLGITVMKLLNP